jgi:hypothetical protein
MYNIFRFLFVCISSCVMISCEVGDASHGTGYHPPYYSVKIFVVDSVASTALENVFVAEMYDGVNLNNIIRGDSLDIPMRDQDWPYYFCYTYTDVHGGIFWTWRTDRKHIPNYSQYVAYKHGYKVWTWSQTRDPVYRLSENIDSLCIRMVHN